MPILNKSLYSLLEDEILMIEVRIGRHYILIYGFNPINIVDYLKIINIYKF